MATNFKITLDGSPSEDKANQTADFYEFILDVLTEIQSEMDAEVEAKAAAFASEQAKKVIQKDDLTYDVQLLTEAVADLSYAASTLADIVAKISDEA